jgi:predicted TIM-barrel fold metal-dependent hydrolase
MIEMLLPFLIPMISGIFLHESENYYLMEDFSQVKKIDTHTHHNSESTALMEAGIKSNFFLLTVNVDVSSYPPLADQIRFSMHQKAKNPEYIDFLSTISLENWSSPDWEKQEIARLKKTFEQGAIGIKIWKNIGMTYKDENGQFIMADHPRLEPIFRYVQEQGKVLMAHLGEPKNCWLPLEEMTVNNDRTYFKEHPEYHMYLHPEYPSYEQQIQARDNLLAKFPDIRFVGAHLGSLEYDVDELAKRLDRFPNMAVDMAARIGHLQVQGQKDWGKVRDFMIKYQDRLIYGTDLGISAASDPERVMKNAIQTWQEDWRFFVTDQKMENSVVTGSFQGLKLPKEVVDKIYYHNAIKWFRPNFR